MKYIILVTAILLSGCGGGGSSSTPTVVTEVVEVPVIERECEEPETIYVVEEVIKEVNNTVYVTEEVIKEVFIESEPEIVYVPQEVIREVYIYPEPITQYVLSRIELDEDGDGEIDRLYIDRTVTDGLVMEEYVNTGTIIFTGTWTYNEAGYPLTYLSYTDGVLSRTNTWEYDEYNNVVRQTELGEPTRSWFYEYRNGEIISIYSDYEDDGEHDSAIFFTYDNNGNRLTITYDRENDGVIDEIRHNTWVEGKQTSVTLPN